MSPHWFDLGSFCGNCSQRFPIGHPFGVPLITIVSYHLSLLTSSLYLPDYSTQMTNNLLLCVVRLPNVKLVQKTTVKHPYGNIEMQKSILSLIKYNNNKRFTVVAKAASNKLQVGTLLWKLVHMKLEVEIGRYIGWTWWRWWWKNEEVLWNNCTMSVQHNTSALSLIQHTEQNIK